MVGRLLVIGKSGFLGSMLGSILAGKGLEVESIGREQMDLSQPVITSAFTEFLRAGEYKYALICSAMTDIEKCFQSQLASHQVNVQGTIQLLQVLQQQQIIPIFFSSDYVFRPKQVAHKEGDVREPQTCYGRQKLAVEMFLEENFSEFLIFRTSKLMAKTKHPKNILWPVLKSISLGQSIQCLVDQWLNPVFVEDIAQVVQLSCEADLRGVYHLGTRQIYTRFELAQFLARALGFAVDLVQPLTIKDLALSEPRPNHNTLDCQNIEKALEFRFTEIEQALGELKMMTASLTNGCSE